MDISITEQTENYFLDLLEADMNTIRECFMAAMDTPAEVWRTELIQLSRTSSLSSRLALMRILRNRVGDGSSDITMAQAEALPPEECVRCVQFLQELASLQADSDPEIDGQLIFRAWYDEKSANDVEEKLLPDEIRYDEKKLKNARAKNI